MIMKFNYQMIDIIRKRKWYSFFFMVIIIDKKLGFFLDYWIIIYDYYWIIFKKLKKFFNKNKINFLIFYLKKIYIYI